MKVSDRAAVTVALVALGLGVLSCGTTTHLGPAFKESLTYEGNRLLIRDNGTRLSYPSFWTMRSDGLDLRPAVILDDARGQHLYMLQAVHYDAYPINILPGESLILRVDGEKILLSSEQGSGGSWSAIPDLGIGVQNRPVESAIYPASRELIQQLATASSIIVVLRGRVMSRDYTFRRANRRAYSAFLDRVREISGEQTLD